MTGSDPTTVDAADAVLAVEHDEYRRVFEDWFADRNHRVVVPSDPSDVDVAADLCIVDDAGYERFEERFEELKEAAPGYLPFLLVATDDDPLGDPLTWERFDDVLVAPVRQPEVTARVEGLLARRRVEATAVEAVRDSGNGADDGFTCPPETLQTSVAYLQELYRVTSLEDLDFEEQLGELLELGRRRLGVPYAFLTRIEDGTQYVVASRGDHPLLQPGESCPLDEAYCRKTIDQEGLLGVRDALAEGWADDPAYETFELGTYVGGKVRVDDELFGTLCFAGPQARERAFSEAERTFIELTTQWVGRELERQRREAELQREVERLDEFASLVSHDLRNPLNVAKGRLEMAVEAHDDENIERAYESLESMERLIEDLLELAREGELVAETEPVSLADTARAAWRTVDAGSATLSVEDATVRADPERLQQLLGNLLGNSVEHGATSSRPEADDAVAADPDLTVTVGPTRDGFYVADDGPGIPEDERDEVFEAGFTTAEDGTGFGLAIVEEIAEAHGWTVSVTESEDGGARFDVET